MLIDAAPRLDAFGRVVTPPDGEIADPIDPPKGCAFHPRCPLPAAGGAVHDRASGAAPFRCVPRRLPPGGEIRLDVAT